MNERIDGVPGEELMARLRSRSEFLKIMGAAGLAAAIGPNILTREASALEPTGPTDPSFSFSVKSDYSAFDVISDNFVEHRDGFNRNQGLYTVLTPAPERQRGGVSLNNGRLRVSGDPFFTLFQTTKAPEAPYAAVIVDVTSFIRDATEQNSVYAGLIKDDENYVMAWYNHVTKKAGFDVAVTGKGVTRLAETPATLGAPVRFAFVLNSKEITALADEGGGSFDGWKPIANYPNEPTVFDGVEYRDPATAPGLSGYVDLRDPNVLAQYKYGFGVRGDSGTIVLDGVEAGYWGRAGVRDPHVVTHADGTPYIEGNKLYFTLTNAGLDFFSTAHWGLYTLDLSDYTSSDALEEVGKLFFKRDGGKVMGDHAGHIVYDNTTTPGNFLIGVSTWGDFTYKGVDIYYTRVLTQNIEDLHGVHVLEGQELTLPTALPTPPTGNWDPHFTRIGQEWYVAFVESPTQGGANWDHHPALAKGSSIENLTLVGATEELKQTEGMVIQKIGGVWYVLCSSGRDEIVFEEEGLVVTPPAYRIYDLSMKLVGVWYDNQVPYPTNIPHPMITPLPVDSGTGTGTKWIMLTFNGEFFYFNFLDYGTHGNFIVMDGPTWEGKYEFSPS